MGDSQDGWVIAALTAFFVTVNGTFWFLRRRGIKRRAAAMQELGQQHRLSWYDEYIPPGFPVRLLDDAERWWRSETIHNLIAGTEGDRYRFACDVRVGWGRTEYTRTFAGVRLNRPARPDFHGLPGDLRLIEQGSWLVITPKQTFFNNRKMMKTETIKVCWDLLDLR